MISISLCMIVKNEEAVLSRCLESIAAGVEEIIIVDTGSDDATKEIAGGFTDKVYHFAWVDDFSAARNFAFSKATMDYQMWLDADDIVTADNLEQLLQLKETLSPETDMVTMKYHIGFDKEGLPTMTSTRERLLKRANNYQWRDAVHEHIPLSGNIFNSDIAICHKKHKSHGERNLRIYQQQLEKGIPFTPRNQYYYARELMDHQHYDEAADYFEQFLAGNQGWREDNIAACLALGYCYGQLKQPQQRKLALLRGFSYDLPRPDICCQLAYDYQANSDYAAAAYWFELALKAPRPNHGGFVLNDYAAFIPHIELAVCYFNLGQLEQAIYHNNLAGQAKPNQPAVEHNRKFFSQQQQKQA